MLENCNTEIIVKNPSSHTILVSEQRSGTGQLIDCTCFNKLHELLRVIALVKQFAVKFKGLIIRDNTSVSGTVTATDIANVGMDRVSD